MSDCRICGVLSAFHHLTTGIPGDDYLVADASHRLFFISYTKNENNKTYGHIYKLVFEGMPRKEFLEVTKTKECCI